MFSFVPSVIRSVCEQDNTDDRGNGRRPNMVVYGKR